MILSMSEQCFIFLSTVGTGFFIGFVYDILRVFRKIIRHSSIFIQAEDMIYWICAGLCVFFLLLGENNGEVRMFMIIGSFLGIMLYFLILSRLFIRVSMKIISIIKSIFKVFVEIILTPLKLFFIPIRFFCKKFINIIKPLKRVLKKIQKYVKIYSNPFVISDLKTKEGEPIEKRRFGRKKKNQK